MTGAAPAPPAAAVPLARVLTALIVAQTGLHAAMAGLRLAVPLDLLREGASVWSVGVLLALFAAAPVLLAMAAGRLADRHGFHRPLALSAALVVAGLAIAAGSTGLPGGRFALLALAATLVGAGTNIALIAVQRSGTLLARSPVERVRVFSWLGIAPSFSNVLGPVGAGLVIDAGGFAAAYLALLLLPLASLAAARAVPRKAPAVLPAGRRRTRDLLRAPAMRRLLLLQGLMAMGWDVHAFAVPILGHGLGFSATTIGLVLGCFTAAVTGVRFVIPLVAQHLREGAVLRAAMLGAGAVFALYPLAATPWAMAGCALVLGVVLGCVQPMMLSVLHRLTPDERHGEALGLRSMTINGTSTLMPLLFGAFGVAIGAAALFWLVGAAIVAGTPLVRGLGDGRSEPPTLRAGGERRER